MTQYAQTFNWKISASVRQLVPFTRDAKYLSENQEMHSSFTLCHRPLSVFTCQNNTEVLFPAEEILHRCSKFNLVGGGNISELQLEK